MFARRYSRVNETSDIKVAFARVSINAGVTDVARIPSYLGFHEASVIVGAAREGKRDLGRRTRDEHARLIGRRPYYIP